jgi:hypothetical protein
LNFTAAMKGSNHHEYHNTFPTSCNTPSLSTQQQAACSNLTGRSWLPGGPSC